jgi:hypothetical protein
MRIAPTFVFGALDPPANPPNMTLVRVFVVSFGKLMKLGFSLSEQLPPVQVGNTRLSIPVVRVVITLLFESNRRVADKSPVFVFAGADVHPTQVYPGVQNAEGIDMTVPATEI